LFLLISITSSVYGQELWPTFHNDAQRTGYASRPGPSDENLLWSYTTGGKIRSSPAISDDSTVYIGSFNNNLYAIDKEGNLKWEFVTDSIIYSPPAIGADGVIYFGSLDGNLYALEDSVTYGKLRWQFPASGAIRSPILIGAKGILYFKAESNKFYAVNPDGSERWVYNPEGGVGNDGAGVTLSPDSTTLYFIAGTGSGPETRAEVYALDTSKTLLWTFDIGGIPFNYPADVSPLVDANGVIYVPTLDAPFYAINPDGIEKWHTSFNVSTLRSTPALGSDGTIYVGSSTSLVAINSADGSAKWTFPTPSGRSVWSSPVIDIADVIYFGDDDNWNLFAVSPAGSLKWTFAPGGEELFNDIASSPAVGWDSTIIFGSASNNILYVLGREVVGVVKTNGNKKWYGPVPAVITGKKGYLEVSPNPFSDKVTINLVMYDVGCRMYETSLNIYDISGRLVKSFSLTTNHSALGTALFWNGKDDFGNQLSSGIYFCILKTDEFTLSKKMVLLE
jgi:outer membrane protein assembly factor BamB